MTRDDDQVWLDTLAGRAPAGEGGVAAREAERLRAGILARPLAEPAPVAVADARREAALVARARGEGLLPDAAGAAPARGRAGWRTALALTAAACLVAVGILLRPARVDETVRGAPGRLVTLNDAQPEALQRSLAGDLRAAGVSVTTYERLGRFGLDADLPVPVPPAVAGILRRHGLPVPSDGVLTVEIAPRAGE